MHTVLTTVDEVTENCPVDVTFIDSCEVMGQGVLTAWGCLSEPFS